MEIKINSYLPITDVEGVGTRFAIWGQDCSLHCKCYANSHMWKKEGGTFFNTEDLIDKTVRDIAKAVNSFGLSVMFFLGFDFKTLKDRKDYKELSKYVDILIDGRYEKINFQIFSLKEKY